MQQPEGQQMKCMEVWSGSQLTAQGVAFGGLDVWVTSKPHGGAHEGGDVYYASSCATGRISRLLLADVAGHGDAVAGTATELRTLMRQFVNRLDQTEFVRLLNQKFGLLTAEGAYATAVVSTFFAPSRRFSVCNAGHPRPLWFQAKDQTWHFLGHEGLSLRPGPSNIPLGLLSMSAYDQFDVELTTGDCIVKYSDALIECCNQAGDSLGEQGLLQMVRDLAEADPQRLSERLLEAIETHYPNSLSDDDVTVMVMRASGKEAEVNWWTRIKAGCQLLITIAKGGTIPWPEWSVATVGGFFIPALGRRLRARRS